MRPAGAAAALLALALACGGETDPQTRRREETAALAAEEPFRTDSASYAWRESDGLLSASIPFSYHNATADTINDVNCNGHLPFAIERETDGVWRHVWASATDACLSEPILIAPGETFRDVADVAILWANRDLPPGTTRDDLTGTFRLAWHSLRSRYREGPTLGDTLPSELRRSTPFELR